MSGAPSIEYVVLRVLSSGENALTSRQCPTERVAFVILNGATTFNEYKNIIETKSWHRAGRFQRCLLSRINVACVCELTYVAKLKNKLSGFEQSAT